MAFVKFLHIKVSIQQTNTKNLLSTYLQQIECLWYFDCRCQAVLMEQNEFESRKMSNYHHLLAISGYGDHTTDTSAKRIWMKLYLNFGAGSKGWGCSIDVLRERSHSLNWKKTGLQKYAIKFLTLPSESRKSFPFFLKKTLKNKYLVQLRGKMEHFGENLDQFMKKKLKTLLKKSFFLRVKNKNCWKSLSRHLKTHRKPARVKKFEPLACWRVVSLCKVSIRL